jgi:thioredoxin reductase/bacterioferritin-associated ferredoxin
MRSKDVVVVGGGPAGIAAALAAADSGADVLLVDEAERIGGHLRLTLDTFNDLPGELAGMRGNDVAGWASGALERAGVEVRSDTVAWGLFEAGVVGIASTLDAQQVQAQAIVVAGGATDIVAPFPGWQLPGVMTATAALRLVNELRVRPGRRAAVVGVGSFAVAIEQSLADVGIAVAARAETHARIVAGGTGRVEWVEIDGDRTEVDLVVIALGRQPDPELALQALCDVEYDDLSRAYVPVRSPDLETSVPGLFVAGAAGGTVTPALAMAEGRLAGRAATASPEAATARRELEELRARVELPPAPEIDLRGVDDAVCVCRCEQVNLGQVRQAIRAGAVSLNDVKRRTRAGMGTCQGIFCMRAVAQLIQEEAGVDLASIVPMTARPPARVIPLAALAALES